MTDLEGLANQQEKFIPQPPPENIVPSTRIAETAYKRFWDEQGVIPSMLLVQLKEPFVQAGFTQPALNEWIARLHGMAKTADIRHFLPRLEGVQPDGSAIQFREEYIEGTSMGENEATWRDEVRRVNLFLKGCIAMAERYGFTFDTRQENFRVRTDGTIKFVDVLPVISRRAEPASLGVARDPYRFIYENMRSLLSSANLYRLANSQQSDFTVEEREYFAQLAQDKRLEERDERKQKREFTIEEVYKIARDIAGELQSSEVVKLAGVFGSVARGRQQIGDIDFFVVVTNATFREIVNNMKERQYRRKNVRNVFYTQMKDVSGYLKLPIEKQEKIARRRNVTHGEINKIIQTHLIALPENLSDEGIEEDLAWVIRQQPDTYFFYNVLSEGETFEANSSLPAGEAKSLVGQLGRSYWYGIQELVAAENRRRTDVRQQFEPEYNPEDILGI